ncbi:class Ib ribonucleoside-diphosphate reductase assembly flavoprotein NrdI [Corynebacterium sp.]|uniref:ribonucleotide reductase stimulatory protein n=1 Tax=Corynebacterium sp. TaxID=1720 RepID=UPI0028A8D71D|nr:class Ib ribonucleoside-diphosphate reductase assembly flavoprotein NrdI [Corynebacterium sp.]
MVSIHYWSSSSGNTRALANKLNTPTFRIDHEPVDDYTVLLCPTYEQPRLGDYIPRPVRTWLGHNGVWVIGVIGTGNRSFGCTFCQAAHDIADALHVPVLYRAELMGTPADIAAIDTGLRQHWKYLQHLRHTGATA